MSADECPKCGQPGYVAKAGCNEPECGHCEHVSKYAGVCVQCGTTLYDIGQGDA